MQKCKGMTEKEKDRLWRLDKPYTPCSERWHKSRMSHSMGVAWGQILPRQVVWVRNPQENIANLSKENTFVSF